MNSTFRLKLREILNDLYEHSKKIIEKTGGHPPILFLLRNTGKIESIDFSTYIEDKDLMAVMLKAYQDQDDLDGSILLTEAWMVAVDIKSEEGKRILGGKDPAITPSASPDKEEVLFFLVETKAGTVAADAPIIRKGKHTSLGPLRIKDAEEGKFSGRFVGGAFTT